MTFVAHGERFTPSKVPAQYSSAHDPGVIGSLGRYRGTPIPYGSADFDVPQEVEEKIAYVHGRVFPFLAAMREAGADTFWLHITYHYEAQCALGFSKDELKMILDLDCELLIDCITVEEAEPGAPPTSGPGRI